MQTSTATQAPPSRATVAAFRGIYQQHRDIHELVHLFLANSRAAADGAADAAANPQEIVALFEQIVLRVQANFLSEERCLMTLGHPTYHDQRAAHRRITNDLSALRDALHRGDPVSMTELLHSLDGLLVHEAVDDVVFEHGPQVQPEPQDWLAVQ
jgi:hemerythrin